ncbi:recombinase A [Vibrio sp. MA40-2]|uniref:recombinase A n=1 Tax=Vibrio sp. MA40-2 TaxID=3391828 RepID=UPI0039A59D49
MQKPVRKAKRIESVMNSALWHLAQRDMTESELLAKLRVKTDNPAWIADTIDKLRSFGYLKSDQDFAQQFAERAFMNEYGSGYIVEKLIKKGIRESFIREAIDNIKLQQNICEQTLLNNRINCYYSTFTISKERLTSTLYKRGFSYNQIDKAIKQHPCYLQLKSNLEIKAEKVDVAKEILKYQRKGKGALFIKQELKQKKVDITEFDSILAKLIESGQVDFFDTCLQQLVKKKYNINDQKERGKAYAMLSRKGFSSEQIQFAFSEMNCL